MMRLIGEMGQEFEIGSLGILYFTCISACLHSHKSIRKAKGDRVHVHKIANTLL